MRGAARHLKLALPFYGGVSMGLGRPGRAALGGAVAAMVVVGCGGDGGDASPPASPAPAGATIERIPTDIVPVGDLQVVGDTVVAATRTPGADGHAELMRSTDGGRTWEPVVLPAAPGRLELGGISLTVADGVAVLTGTWSDVPRPGAYAWVSSDGVEWVGGPLPVAGPPGLGEVQALVLDGGRIVAGLVTEPRGGERLELFHSDDQEASWTPAAVDADSGPSGGAWLDAIWVEGDRLLAVAGADSSRAPWVLESEDAGASWQRVACPEHHTTGDGCAPPSSLASGSLLLGPEGVSVDGGESWSELTIEPAPARAGPYSATLERAVQLPGGGGWLGASGTLSDPVSGFLARTDDGERWEQVYGTNECRDEGFNREILGPVPLGAGWLVVHSCLDITGDAASSRSTAWAELHVLDSQGIEVEPLDGSRDEGGDYGLGGDYEPPVAVDGAALVPTRTRDETIDVLRVTP